MIKANDLGQNIQRITVPNGGATLQEVENIISQSTVNMGIPVAFSYDTVKSGNIFNQVKEDALIIYHPKFKSKYYMFCIRIQTQGISQIVLIDQFGSSKNEISGKSRKKMEDEINWYSLLNAALDTI